MNEGAVLFADVSGSTKLYETVGDAVAHSTIETLITLMRERTTASRGRVIKTIGDEIMAVFPAPNDAADAAMEMQLGTGEMLPVGGNKLGLRIGFHFGPLVERDGDVFGDTVNLAARLTELASKGQIITSRETRDQLSPLLKNSSRRLYAIPVKGKANEVELYEMLWQTNVEATQMATRTVVRAKRTSLRIKYHDVDITLSEERPALLMGRDQSADLVIRDKMASRSHGKIEQRLDKYVLSDHSANGTFVTVEGEKEILLRREEFILRGHGMITFGQSRSGTEEVVEYFCE